MPPKRKKHGFSRQERLVKPADFVRAYTAGTKTVGNLLVLYVYRTGGESARLGVSVGKKSAGGIVRKNRIKRLLREAFRLNKDNFGPGWDLVVVPRTEAIEKPVLAEIGNEMVMLAKKAKGSW